MSNSTTRSSETFLNRRPEWLIATIALCSWPALIPLLWSGPPHGHHGTDHHTTHDHVSHTPTAQAPSVTSTAGVALAVWVLMTVAMMLPTAIPAIRYTAFATHHRRRQRSVLLFALGFVAAWLPLAVPAVAWHLSGREPTVTVTAVTIILVSMWELTRTKRRALLRCHRTAPVRFTGRPADRSALAFGVTQGMTCVLTCGPAMLALMILNHPVVATILVAAAMPAQKILRWGIPLRVPFAAAGLGVAAIILITS